MRYIYIMYISRCVCLCGGCVCCVCVRGCASWLLGASVCRVCVWRVDVYGSITGPCLQKIQISIIFSALNRLLVLDIFLSRPLALPLPISLIP